MLNKYLKYIYALIIFYIVWLVGVPLGFKLFAVPVLEQTLTDVVLIRPRLYTSILPNIKFKSDEIIVLDKTKSKALDLTKPKLSIRILPLLTGKIHINSFETDNIDTKIDIKDKLYIGEYPIELDLDKNINVKINRIKINNFKFDFPDNYSISGNNVYFKDARKSFIFHSNLKTNYKGKISISTFDVNLPHNKNLKKTKFNIDISEFDLNPLSEIVNKCIYKEIVSLNGVINLASDNKKMYAELNNFAINCENKYNSILFPDKFYITSNYKIGKDSFKIKKLTAKSNKIKTEVSGVISNIFSNTPKVNLEINLDKSDLRECALLLPPIVTPDISVPKLKEYPFYANIFGKLKIKGKLPEPDITGNIKVTDGILIKPIPNATGGANINIDFIGKQLLLDVVVPAGGREVVYVSGDVMIYGDKFAHLKVKSSKSVNLETAEFVVNPLHEILCFVIGPVPIMEIRGHGNVDIRIVGTKKDPHIWGEFNFADTSARFLEINNLKLEHATGNLEFNNQNAHFINHTGTLHGQPATIDGVCTLFGNLDFDVTANNQNLSDLYTIITTSPMLESIKTSVPQLTDVTGKSDFYLKLKGKLKDIADLKINENVFTSGHIKLLGNSVKFETIPIHNIKGIINYDKTDADFDIKALVSSASTTTVTGSLKDGIANIKINSPKIKVNELAADKLKYLDPLYVKLKAHYKGLADAVEIGGVDADIEVLKDNKPVKNGKIISGKITLKNSNLTASNIKGIVKQNPFNIHFRANNIGKKELDLTHANINGEFNCRDLDLTVINLIAKAKILPANLQKELEKLNFKSGNATINAKAKHSRLDSVVNLKETNIEYNLKQKNETTIVPLKILSCQINVKNNTINLKRFNCLVDDMPVIIYGTVSNFYKNPQYNVNLNSKLVQKIFDKYWNANNIYPVKINGDILYTSTVKGDKNHVHVKSDMKIGANSNIYYMGATIGDNLNPITVNVDADVEKNGWIKLNKFKYNKLIASQNNKQNTLPVLSISGQLKQIGKIYAIKNLVVKTENPANADFFNIIFKKPTIKQGNFTSDICINGTSNHPKIIGKFYANNMEMPYLNTSIKDLAIDFKPDNIQVTTKGEVLDNYIMINSSIKNNLIPPYRVNNADIYINDFDINNSLSQFKQMELKGFSSAIAPDADAAGSEIINHLILNNVKIRAGIVRVKNIKASNLEAVCSLNNRMNLSVDSFKFNMASGDISGKIAYNLLNNYMQMELDANKVNANALTIALFDLPNQIFGSLTGHIELSCNATDDKTRLNTLSGYGTFSVKNGRMPKLGSLEYLLKAGNLIKGGITGLSMNGIIDIVTPMKTGEFSSITGRIRLKDGIAKTIEISTIGKNLSLYTIGSLNLYTQVADMHVFGQLSKKASTILGAAGNISLNTLFNKIPGISLDSNGAFINDLNKIPGVELSNKSHRKFMVEILGDVNSDNFVKSFKWIN